MAVLAAAVVSAGVKSRKWVFVISEVGAMAVDGLMCV